MRNYLLLLLTLSFSINIQAQIDPNSLIGVHNADETEINNINSPVKGSLIFNTDDSSVYVFDGSDWSSLISNGDDTKLIVGDNVTITGSGTNDDPYKISAKKTTLKENPDGSYTFSNGIDADITFTPKGTKNTPIVSRIFSNGFCANKFSINETSDVVINGEYFDGSSTVSIPGHIINSTVINSSTKITANVTASASTGNFDILVSNTAGTGTLPNGFNVESSLTSYTFAPSDMVLSNQMSYAGGVLSRTSSTGWNQQGYSTAYGIPAGGEGHLSFTADTNTRIRMIALNTDPATNASYTTLDFAMYLHSNKRIYIYESGSSKGNKTTYLNGDKLEINVDCNGKVTYLKNGTAFYTSLNTASGTLYLDSSIYQTAANISNISITY